ncbi:glycoside hydrolase [Coemansia spiralis]|nr:glycoside hydrolase [Coemansia spiralis]
MQSHWSQKQLFAYSALTFILLSTLLYIPLRTQHSEPANMPRKVGYFTAWSIYDRKFVPADVPVEKLTHINYGFAKLENNCIAVGDSWADFNNDNGTARRRNPQLRSLISVGGWTWSGGFSDMAASEATRRVFVHSVAEFLQNYKFDGIDIDWEHPVEGGMDGNKHSPRDAHNYLLLLRELRYYLDSQVPTPRFGRYEITIATSAAPFIYKHMDLHAISQVVDHINIMTYDYAGSWSSVTGHQQNLFRPAAGDSGINGNDTVSDYMHRGVPPEKIVLGVGFYGRGFSNVASSKSQVQELPGLGCPFSGVPQGTWEAGSFDYKALRSNHMVQGSGYTLYWDDAAKAPILYSAQDRVMITLDDPVAISWKADYVLKQRLGGIMIWELSQDHNNELLDKICEYLG